MKLGVKPSTTSNETKICRCCGEILPITEFSKDQSKKGGLCSYCHKCAKVKHAIYRKTHATVVKEKSKIYNTIYRERNKINNLNNPIPKEKKPNKKCNNCGRTLPASSFYVQLDKKDGLNDECKNCLESYRASDVAMNIYLKRLYGVSINEYKSMLEQQDNKCAICSIEFSAGKIGKPRVDHDHITGKVRGLLCNHCNIGLGSFFNSIVKLYSAYKYVKNEGNYDTGIRLIPQEDVLKNN